MNQKHDDPTPLMTNEDSLVAQTFRAHQQRRRQINSHNNATGGAGNNDTAGGGVSTAELVRRVQQRGGFQARHQPQPTEERSLIQVLDDAIQLVGQNQNISSMGAAADTTSTTAATTSPSANDHDSPHTATPGATARPTPTTTTTTPSNRRTRSDQVNPRRSRWRQHDAAAEDPNSNYKQQ